MALLAQTTYTVKRAAKDGYSVSLSPESIVLTKNSSGVVSDLSTAKTKVSLTVGGNGVTPAIGTLVVSGCAATKSGMDITITSVLASSGYVDIPVTYKNFSATKRFTFTTVMVDPVTIKKEVQSQLAVESELIVAEVTATTKVYVNGKMDELTIGGRNLLLNSAIERSGSREYVSIEITDIAIANLNKQFTFSFDVCADISGTINFYSLGGYGININNTFSVTTEWKRFYSVGLFSYHQNDPNGDRCILSWYGIYGTGVKPHIRNVKVELGNKATDWTPAPEDVDASISKVQTQVTSAVSRLTIAETSISTLVSRTTTIGNTVTSHSTSINQLNNQIALKADSTTVTGINTRLISAETKITPDAINLTVKSQITTAVNDVQVGGRNLLLNSKISRSASSYNIGYWTCSRDFIIGETLTVTIKGNIPGSKLFGIWFNSGSYGGYALPKIVDGYSKTITVPTGTSTRTIGIYLISNQSAGDSWSFDWIKLESGNKATDWTPAPEDVDAAIALRPTTTEIKAGISITSGGISVFGQTLSLAGKVTFSSLDSSTQSTINGKATTGYVDSAKSSAISTAASDATTKANTALTNAKSYSDTLKNSLGGLAYLSAVSLAKLDSTIVEGGYIKTSLINADAIITTELLARKIQATDISTSKLTVNDGARIGDLYIYGGGLCTSPQGLNPADLPYLYLNKNSFILNAFAYSTDYHYSFNNRTELSAGKIAIKCITTGTAYVTNPGLQIEVSGNSDDTAINILAGYISGFRLRTLTVRTSQTLSVSDGIIISEADSEITLTLPSNPGNGKMYFIRKNGGGRIWVNGSYIINDGDWYRERSTSVQLNRGCLAIFMYNGTYWTYNTVNG
ncbi:hypothetical protein [Bacteroides ihuae]|uniref:hypothetical protein n=1 Tax=Bacteroides ihuae TaxID=1852362 RepID=UPI0008DADBAB|nr:hypothetical protein [Bacteroides ihuae]